MTGRGWRRHRLAGAGALGMLCAILSPVVALAHPLGNFTINHYADLRVAPNGIYLDVVIDQAEIPTFSERQRIDADGDGSVSDAEAEAERLAACSRLAPSFKLTIDGSAASLVPYAAGLAFPPGAAGLSTMRTTCEYSVPLDGLGSGRAIGFEDDFDLERIGWRAIRVEGDGAAVSDTVTTRVDGASQTGVDLSKDDGSQRLTAYPTALLTQAPNTHSVQFTAKAGGATLAPFALADASPLPGVAQPPAPGPVTTASPSGAAPSADAVATAVPATPAPIQGSAVIPIGAIPGGIQDQISSVLSVKDLSPIALIGSLLLAVGLGALHAVSPGHGKTVMAAYLVGSRGSARHAVVLGMTVTVSHTLGVLALAAVTLFASSLIPPERLYPILGVGSAATVVLIGVWLFRGRLQILRAARSASAADHAHDHEHDHDHGTVAMHAHAESHEHATADDRAHGHDHPHDEHEAAAHAHPHVDGPGMPLLPGEHSHGGRTHSHLPAPGTELTWRTLFTLGLAGGLVPSASALLLLLGSLAANRPAYGLVLVVAFGLGMAIVLAGVGLALVYAGRYVERMPQGQRFRRAWDILPIATSVVVVGAGLFLMTQALTTVL